MCTFLQNVCWSIAGILQWNSCYRIVMGCCKALRRSPTHAMQRDAVSSLLQCKRSRGRRVDSWNGYQHVSLWALEEREGSQERCSGTILPTRSRIPTLNAWKPSYGFLATALIFWWSKLPRKLHVVIILVLGRRQRCGNHCNRREFSYFYIECTSCASFASRIYHRPLSL